MLNEDSYAKLGGTLVTASVAVALGEVDHLAVRCLLVWGRALDRERSIRELAGRVTRVWKLPVRLLRPLAVLRLAEYSAAGLPHG